MRSHEYKTSARELVTALVPTAITLAALVAFLKVAVLLGLAPPRAVALDPNSTVLAHQSRAARSHHPAQIVLVGDSTCMMDVDARALGQQLPGSPRALNLGLLIFMDFKSYAEVLSDFVAANPKQVRVVILLVTPDKLGGPRSEGVPEFWREIRLQDDTVTPALTSPRAATDWFGLKCVRENFLGHLLATPLRGRSEGAARFGFSSEVDAYMTSHDGTPIEFGEVIPPRERPQRGWRFAEDLEIQSRALRAKVPPGAKLLIGLTPLAQSYSPPGDREQRVEMLQQWNWLIQADAILTNLPAAWPDPLFASKGHLNEIGQKKFTALLASQLAPLLDRSGHAQLADPK